MSRLSLSQRVRAAAAKRPLSIPFELAFHVRQRQERALPNALIIGGQKCGTSSLYKYLCQHPQVAGVVERPNAHTGRWITKEVHYLNQRGANKRPASWYRAHFGFPQAGVINLEATPDYLTSVEAPMRAVELIPKAMLILVLRNPVDRAFSAYHHMLRAGIVHESFTAHVERKLSEPERRVGSGWDILKKGRYAEGLERWLAHFPRSQFHIIDFHDLTDSTDASVADIVTFLGLSPAMINTKASSNVGGYSERPAPEAVAKLREYYEPHNRRLESLLGFSMGW